MYGDFSETLERGLGLTRKPVAMSFLPTPPDGVPHFSSLVPSACTFWSLAEKDLFYTSAEDHHQCPIGAMTMGFPIPEEKKEEADQLFSEMLKLEYLSKEEFPKFPSVKKSHQFILYGPFGRFVVMPDVVLLRVLPKQTMLLSEALGTAAWTKTGLRLVGRPTCAAIPVTMEHQEAVATTACIGARVYAELSDEEFFVVIPGPQLKGLEDRLATILEANKTLGDIFERRKKEVSKL